MTELRDEMTINPNISTREATPKAAMASFPKADTIRVMTASESGVMSRPNVAGAAM